MFKSLQQRLIAGMLALLSIGLFFVGIALINDAKQQHKEFSIAQAVFQAASLASASIDGLASKDYELLERWVNSALPSDDYAYASLVRPDGVVLTHTNINLIASKTDPSNQLLPRTVESQYNGRPVMIAMHPVVLGKHHLANAQVAFFLDHVHHLKNETITNIVLLLLVSLGLIGLGTVYIARRIVRPLERLRTLVAETDLEKGVTIDSSILASSDEVGMLARTFAGMSKRLVGSHLELQQHRDELEARVRLRTQELEAANSSVRAHDAHLSAVMENIADALITISRFGHIESYNRAAEKLFGYSPSEVIGKNVSMLMPPTESEKHDQHINRYLKTGEAKIIGKGAREVTGQHKNGKPLTLELTVNKLENDGEITFIGALRDVSERKKHIEELKYLADHDGLTGLYNRAYFNTELDRTIQRYTRGNQTQCGLLYLDLDNFKYINDTLGHSAGDIALVDITNVILKRLRNTDIAARVGGDEFNILLFDVDANQADEIAESYRKHISDYVFIQGDRKIDVGCSIGVAMLGGDNRSTKDFIAQADFACRQAKKSGRNCVRAFKTEDSENLTEMSADVDWSRRIKEAIKNDFLTLHFQAIQPCDDKPNFLFEVLLRMIGGDGELIMPGGFLPAAERFGLMIDLDSWVIDYALSLLVQFQQQHPDASFSINVTPQTLESGKLTELVQPYIALGLKPESVIFEITESTAIYNFSSALSCINKIKSYGFKTALDDFGTGFSSFAYIQELPIDIVKIDGRFITGLSDSASNQAMVRAMVDISHSMNIKVIAEWVEDAESLAWLQVTGVDYVQGFHIGKPVTEAEIRSLLPLAETPSSR